MKECSLLELFPTVPCKSVPLHSYSITQQPGSLYAETYRLLVCVPVQHLSRWSLRPVRRSRHDGRQTTGLLPPDSPADALFRGAVVYRSSDTVAHVGGITGRSSPAPNGGDADPEGRSVRARNDLPPRRQLTASPTSKPLPPRGPRQGERSRLGSVTTEAVLALSQAWVNWLGIASNQSEISVRSRGH